MRVAYFGLYDHDYPRNAVLRRGLQAHGAEVLECRETLGRGDTPSLLPTSRTRSLVERFREIESSADALVVAEFNQALVPLAAALARRRRIPVVADFLISLYDTAVRDRGQNPLHPRSPLLYVGDVAALRLADGVLVDTAANARFYAETYGLDLARKMATIPVGAPEWQFSVTPLPPRDRRPLNVLFYGSFIPLHGAEVIIDAAHRLEGDGRFRFVLLGSGQTLQTVRARHRAKPSGNVEFRDPVEFQSLPLVVAAADVCLGVFGTTAKAARVIPNKVWQSLAMGRPVITGDTQAAREVLTDGRNCLLVPTGDSKALAAALQRLAEDAQLGARIAEGAATLFVSKYTSRAIGGRLCELLESLTALR